MNKNKKIVMAVVSTVMAGTMLASMAACGPNRRYTPPSVDELEEGYRPQIDKDGRMTYSEGTEIATRMGYNNTETGITYNSKLIQTAAKDTTASSAVVAGKTYVSGDLKPAWQALSDTLGITVKDDWVANMKKTGENLDNIKTTNNLGNYGIITESSSIISTEGTTTDNLLNLNLYLDWMPNYKAFLESNAVVRMAITADTDTGAMYMVPYFDGNDDIEKYVLMRKDIVEKLLDTADVSAATGTFAGQAAAKNAVTSNQAEVTAKGTAHSVESFMGKTAAENYKINVTDPAALTGTATYGNNLHKVDESKKMNVVELTVDYGAVITALGNSDSELYKAVVAAGVATPQKASGNIVDIQNQIIDDTQGAVTGAKLIKVLQEYIKVAYHKTGETAPFYTKLSDVFNSAYAAWDVDLYVALGRCAVSSSALLGNASKGETAYFLGSRYGKTDRTYDVASMAGELYGVRGLTSRYSSLYAYINKDGGIVDARTKTDMWDALAKMHALAEEGLYYTGLGTKVDVGSIAASGNGGVQIYSSTDYVQTQTKNGGFKLVTTEDGYNYAPILTPVSRWDTDDNGSHETVMRFTESWRGVKDGGICVLKSYVKDQPEKLSAILTLIDWMYSNDGQMVLTYGPFSEKGNVTTAQAATVDSTVGTWYGTPVNMDINKAFKDGIVDTHDDKQYYVTEKYQGQYFCYGNKLYTGTYYKGKMVPTMTTASYDAFIDTAIGNGNFTNYARQIIGSALNFGNKDQGFEYQCTATCGLVGADIWAIAEVNGTIKHTLPGIDANNYWYTLVPTLLPFTKAQSTAMSDNYAKVCAGKSSADNYFYANKEENYNILTDVMYYGYDTSKTIHSGGGGALPGDAQGIISLLNESGLNTVSGFMTSAWDKVKTYYNSLTKK
ncbi:MAG: hypothetical protein HDP34_01980 [Clostridia bacterium]|nr:hypothetical protein [Clostridia bacterium]